MSQALTDIISGLSVIQVTGNAAPVSVKGITYDSRLVDKGFIFIAIRGYKTDGHNYITNAINKGAIAVILEDNSLVPDEFFDHMGCVKIMVKESRKAMAEASAIFYNYPSKSLGLTAITGTKGKTTVSYFLENIFNGCGKDSGVMGTVNYRLGERVYKSGLTTPESVEINELLSKMIADGASNCVMEVSSHALELKRTLGLDIDVAVFTNITSDHMDFHDSFENYLKAKKILFDDLKPDGFALVNRDDPSREKLTADCGAGIFTYGADKNCDFRISDITFSLEGTNFNLEYKGESYSVHTCLIGAFNASNAAAAIGAAVLSGISPGAAVMGINNTPQVPGRFEVVAKGEKRVIIDYSHTSGSLEEALKAIHHITKGEIPVYTVMGCGGDRDKTKRPVMGSIAEKGSDMVMVTSDNPRTEDPFKIIDDIIPGFSGKRYKIIEDRELAIKAAIEESPDNAVVLVAGKGHENYQEIDGVRRYFSDKETAEKYL